MAYTQVKTDQEIVAMRKSGAILAEILDDLCLRAKVGTTGKQLDEVARQKLTEAGVKGPFLGYQGFPAALCVSVNDAVVHGIPNDQAFVAGDIVSLDFGVEYEGMITDAARTVLIGDDHSEAERLMVKQTQIALDAGIDVLKDGVRVGDIAASVQAVLDKAQLGIVRDLVGHGVGHQLHEDPNIPNYGYAGSGPTLKAGMTIAIEPMATLGDFRVYVDHDQWTVRTRDGSKAAHFEDTVLITPGGYEVLTRR